MVEYIFSITVLSDLVKDKIAGALLEENFTIISLNKVSREGAICHTFCFNFYSNFSDKDTKEKIYSILNNSNMIYLSAFIYNGIQINVLPTNLTFEKKENQNGPSEKEHS